MFKHYNKSLFVIAFGFAILLLISVLQSNILALSPTEEMKKIPMYMIKTRNYVNPNYESVEEPGYGNYSFLNTNQLTQQQPCQEDEVTIFVHGWGASEDEAKERFDRVKMSLENNNFTHPLVGFSWPSDTVWHAAKFIAKENGPKLAKFILNLKNNCPETEIRLLAHSLGSRVVLSSLDSLHKDPLWNINNFTIASVHLMAAAVDNEEVSINPADILIDQTNWGTPKSDYGQAIEEEVVKFYNLYSSADKMLAPNLAKPYYPYQVYPSAEADWALGQSGYQKVPESKIKEFSGDLKVKGSLPGNYIEKNVTHELLAICDADADNKPDLPFLAGETVNIGENHGGYMGFRENKIKLVDDGAIDVVVHDWENKIMLDNKPNFDSKGICK
jgi:Alpha/beta hydrolase of unknown function (DUF900)